jgi:hypothetical protein
VVLLFLPFKRTLDLGNIDVAVLLLWVLGVFLLHRGRRIPSALCFALGTAIKVSPVFAVPLFALRRQWSWFAWYLTWSVGLLLVSVWGVGWQNQVVWAGQVAPAVSCGLKTFWNRSLAGLALGLNDPHNLLPNLPGPYNLCLFNKALGGICYCAFLFWCWRKRQNSRGLIFELALLPLVVLLISPVTWSHHYVIAVLPLTYLWVRPREEAAVVSKLDLILLASSTLTFGSALPEFIARAFGAPGELFVMGGWVAATVALLWVGMRMYGSCVGEKEQAVGEEGGVLGQSGLSGVGSP